MDKFIVDEQLAGKLFASPNGLELFDSSNRKLGFFIPSAESEAELYAWANSLWTDEEIEERSRQPGVYTTAEVLKRLAEL